jgi:hypothetical protein
MEEIKKLTPHKKELLKEFVNHICENCNKEFKSNHDNKGLQIHRINRGGKYELRNIFVLCRECHKMRHQGEYNWIKGK